MAKKQGSRVCEKDIVNDSAGAGLTGVKKKRRTQLPTHRKEWIKRHTQRNRKQCYLTSMAAIKIRKELGLRN